MYMNPAEFVIDLVNTDFARNQDEATKQLCRLQDGWQASQHASVVSQAIEKEVSGGGDIASVAAMAMEQGSANPLLIPFTLIHRSFIKSYRDVVAYGIRVAMYMGLAIMMGTVWLRLSPDQSNINSFTNAIFFGGAFMSFMVCYSTPS